MALDGVPWFIGGEAEHGGNVARMLAYLAANGKQGVVAPTDMKVLPLDVPGAGVKVLAGGASVLNRVSSQEAYTVRNGTTDVDSVKIPASGSTSTQSYLVVLRVDNPNVDGNAQAPADPKKGPYVKFAALPVPAGTRRLAEVAAYSGLSAIELARVDLPKSTGTVTSSMITDLRQLANPRTERVIYTGSMPDPVDAITLSGTPQFIPSTGIPNVEVPEWATHAAMRVDTTMLVKSDDVRGMVYGYLGDLTADSNWATQRIDGPAAATNGSLVPLSAASNGYWPVPSRYRGVTKTVRTRATGTGKVGTVGNSFYLLDVTWTERIA